MRVIIVFVLLNLMLLCVCNRQEDRQEDMSLRRFVGYFICTGYCPDSCCNGDQYAWGKTALGYWPVEGRTMAACRRVLEVHRWYIVMYEDKCETLRFEDTGGGIRGYHIDRFFSKHSDCKHFKKVVKIYEL